MSEIKLKNTEVKQLKEQKEAIEKQSAMLIKQLETKHLQAVEEMENIFEQKLLNNNEQLLDMEKKYLKEKVKNK